MSKPVDFCRGSMWQKCFFRKCCGATVFSVDTYFCSFCKIGDAIQTPGLTQVNCYARWDTESRFGKLDCLKYRVLFSLWMRNAPNQLQRKGFKHEAILSNPTSLTNSFRLGRSFIFGLPYMRSIQQLVLYRSFLSLSCELFREATNFCMAQKTLHELILFQAGYEFLLQILLVLQ